MQGEAGARDGLRDDLEAPLRLALDVTAGRDTAIGRDGRRARDGHVRPDSHGPRETDARL